MSPESCPRLFEAEAVRDGRLAGAERASFERHAKGCVACACELEALEALAAALRAGCVVREDELHERREKTRLLRDFDRELLASGDSVAGGRGMGWTAVVAIVATLAAVLAVAQTRRMSERGQPVDALHAVIRPDPTASWSERIEGSREVITLERGTLRIHVDHGAGMRRLLVLLPDGELEDTGTTFTVMAVDGRTTRVNVEEGRVVLRLRGSQSVTVGRGETWGPTAPAPSASLSDDPTPVSEPASSAPQSTSSRATSSFAKIATGLDASVDFRDAMAALDRGDNHESAAGFARFLSNHPSDPRAEDAAYLRVIALQRSGDRRGMRAAALAYLRRYPTGFRRAEVEPLSR